MDLLILPYVKGLPDDGQSSITWVRNGDLLIGSSTRLGHDGNLNAMSSQLYDDIVVLDKNIHSVNGGLTQTATELKALKDFIDESGSLDLIQKVEDNSNDILILQTQMIDTNTNFAGIKEEFTVIKNQMGVRPPEEQSRTVWGDISFLKIRIGNERNQDFNGNPVPSVEPSGLIKRIADTTTQALKNRDDIVLINKTLSDTNIGTLKIDVDQLRTEIGPKSIVGELTIKARLTKLESDEESHSVEMGQVKTSIGLGSIVVVDELSSLKNGIDGIKLQLDDPTNGLATKVEQNHDAINNPSTGLIKLVGDNKTAIATLNTSVNDPSTGISKKVNDLNTFTGIGQTSPDQSTLAGKIVVLTALSNDNASAIADIQNEIGNTTSFGMKYDIVQINTKIADHETRIKALETKYTALEARVAKLENP